ncbi:MAG: phosphodiester glycosidase family protein [Dysgonomonas sp.]
MRTRTNQWGEELLLKPINGDWETLNNYDGVKCTVEAKSTLGNMLIPKGRVVVSAHGSKRKDYTENIEVGDEVTLNIGLSSNSGKLDLMNMTGAESIILQNGKVQENTGSIAKTKAPRTAIGYSTDESKIFLVVVEGRIERSSGVLTNELGDILLYLGATDGVNLDGGGSSCMILNGEVQNILSDGENRMRKVSNIWTIAKYK